MTAARDGPSAPPAPLAPAVPPLRRLRAAAGAVVDLGLPGRCAGCEEVGRAPLCDRCARLVVAGTWVVPRLVSPRPRPAALPPVVATGPYAGVLRRLVTAYKDDGRRDLLPLLSGLLARAISPLVVPHVVLVPMPSSRASRRRRGDAPLLELTRHAAARVARHTGLPPGSLVVVDALRVTRRVADQAGLGRLERARNLEGAYAVRPHPARRLAGRELVLVDDVVTTGATLAEAARALGEAGLDAAAVATIAATRRRGGEPDRAAVR